jgi:hypothetical protein
VNQLAQFLRQHDTARLNLLGLNDCFGSDSDNAALANARTLNVKNAFPSGLHGRIALLHSSGKSFLVPNDTPLHRAINRSVQIELIPPAGVSCPRAVPLESQLAPGIARGGCQGNDAVLLRAAKMAVPIAITALSRVRNWRDSRRTRALLDIYFATTNDENRQKAADQIAGNLSFIIPVLQKPVINCALPRDPTYSRLCPSDTIADAGGASGIRIPTFCFPQFVTITRSSEAQAMTVIHEFSHNFAAKADYGAYYTADCLPSARTVALSHDLRLSHADSFACFVGMVARQPPQYRGIRMVTQVRQVQLWGHASGLPGSAPGCTDLPPADRTLWMGKHWRCEGITCHP